MILSKKSRYGIRALIDLSVNTGTEHMSLNMLAERNGISPQYLEQIFASLRKAEIVRSIKGPQGGYRLACPASEITLARIIRSLEGTYHVEPETDPSGSEVHGITQTIQHMVIESVNDKLDEVLESVTLQMLEDDYIRNIPDGQAMYYI